MVAAHENQVFRANGFRNALQKLSGNDDIRVALISNTKAFNVHENTDSTLVGDVKGRKCIIVRAVSFVLKVFRTVCPCCVLSRLYFSSLDR